MSLPILILIMILAGIAGGYINFLLPSNIDTDGKKLRNVIACIALGIGATILVPLFLEIAQSKLMDNIHNEWKMLDTKCNCHDIVIDTSSKLIDKTVIFKKDSVNNISPRQDTLNIKITNASKVLQTASCCVPLKNYFLFVAYCFLAAAAGFRFINNLIDSVLKDKQIAVLKEKNIKIEEEKDQEKKAKEKLDAQNKLEAGKEEIAAFREIAKSVDSIEKTQSLRTPVLSPITHPDDPQKGRFGGEAIRNKRQLKADVKESAIPGFYNVTIWVESLDTSKPLIDDVIFYLHDSFRPSVYSIKVSEFINGKAIDDKIVAYGAFTVGAIADDGITLLELDLSEDKGFPKEFRER